MFIKTHRQPVDFVIQWPNSYLAQGEISAMKNLGYAESPEDPMGWIPHDAGLPVDVHTDIWYMTTMIWPTSK